MTRLAGFALAVTVGLLGAACGDDGPTATPEQDDAIAALIDAELSTDEQRCVLEGLIDTEIAPTAIIDGSITGDEDAELLGVAAGCIEDLTRIPSFVDAFIDGAAAEGTSMTRDEAICAIRHLEADDPARAVAECLSADAPGTTTDVGDDRPGVSTYGDDAVLDLLWDACEAGNNQTCDELTATSPEGSDYQRHGRTCAGRAPDGATNCFDELG